MALIIGTPLSDVLFGTSEADEIHGDAGDDVIYGLEGDDLIFGGAGNDAIFAGPGDDIVDGGEGDDVIFGEQGDDVLFGDAGDDVLFGGEGDDELHGGPGNDILYGDAGADVLFGGAGDDLINGGPGGDLMWGGPGADRFEFTFQIAVDTEGGDPETVTLQAPDLQGAAQNQFVRGYRDWLKANGIDVDDPASGWTWSQNDAAGPLRHFGEPVGVAVAVSVQTGKKVQTRWIADEVPVEGEASGPSVLVMASDGHDVIGDFEAADRLEFSGLGELADLDPGAMFALTLADVGGTEAPDTVLSWDGGSITLLDWSEWDGLEAAFASDQILLV